MRGLEGLEELLEHLLLGFLAGDDIGVLETGVDSLDVIVVEVAIAVLVHDGEGFGDNCFTVGVHGPANGTEELIVLDQTVAVAVEEAEELLDFALGEAKTEVCHALAELIFVQGHGVVIVHDSELTTQADDATGTTRCKLLAELLDQHVGGDSLLGGSSASNSVTEEVGGELTVGDNTRLIVIINAEESVEVLILHTNLKSWSFNNLTCRVGIMIPIFSMALANSSGLKSPLLLMSKNLKALRRVVSSDWMPVAFCASLALRSFSKL